MMTFYPIIIVKTTSLHLVIVSVEGRGCIRKDSGLSLIIISDRIKAAFRPIGIVIEEISSNWLKLCI